jgi:hypothetical protein
LESWPFKVHDVLNTDAAPEFRVRSQERSNDCQQTGSAEFATGLPKQLAVNAASHRSEVEATAWVLIAIFMAAMLILSYLFWQRITLGV